MAQDFWRYQNCEIGICLRVWIDHHLTYLQLKNVVEKIIWLSSVDIKFLDLAKTAISWEYVNNNHTRKCQWSNLLILNITKLVTMEFEVTTAFANLAELNVCEYKFMTCISWKFPRCAIHSILNVSGCSITDFGIEKASLESLIFINISNCKFVTERSIHHIVENWETSLCPKGLNHSVVQLEELYGDDMQAGIISLCGLRTEQEWKCMYCRETIFHTWTDITGNDSLLTLIMTTLACFYSEG